MASGETSERWNRRRIGRWLLTLGAGCGLLALFLIGLLVQATPDLLWGVTHHWTAEYEGRRFRVPFGWRQQETPTDEHAIELRKTLHWGLGGSRPEMIDLRVSDRPFHATEVAAKWEQIQTHRMTPGETLEPTPTDEFLLSHYRCSDVLRARSGEISLRCFDRRGRWLVSALGHDAVIHDLAAVLRELPPSTQEDPPSNGAVQP